MLKAELIEQNKNLVKQNGELLYLLEFGKIRCEDSKHQMIWELDSNAKVLQQKIQKQREVIDKAIEWVKDWRHGANDWFEEDSKPSELLDILRGMK